MATQSLSLGLTPPRRLAGAILARDREELYCATCSLRRHWWSIDVKYTHVYIVDLTATSLVVGRHFGRDLYNIFVPHSI